MGCSCKKNLHEEEIRIEKVNGLKEVSKIIEKENLNYNNNNNNNTNANTNNIIYKNQNVLLTKKSKTFQNTTSKEENTNQLNNLFSFERENSKNTNDYKQIETNKITNEELNNFLSSCEPLNDLFEVEIRPTTLCENNSIYYGEWVKNNNIRHGRGIQIYANGAKYFGQWKKNHASGKGKLIHPNGEVYEGEWDMDKPNGHGEYKRKDGSK